MIEAPDRFTPEAGADALDGMYVYNATPLSKPPGGAATIPQMIMHHGATAPERVAMRHKQLGKWQEITYADYVRRAAHVGLGLREIGIGPGDVVAIHSENRPEWMLTDIAVQGLGAISTGVYETSPSAEVEYLLSHCSAKAIIVEDERQFDKTWEVRSKLPALERIIVIETRGIRVLDDELVMTFDEVEAIGASHAQSEWEQTARDVDPSTCANLVYTSGTTGPPKAAMLSNENLVYVSCAIADLFGATSRDEGLSYLPLCHVAEKVFTVMGAAYHGYTANFGEGIETLPSDLREVQPTLMLGVPRIWERMLAQIQIRMQDASRLKKASFNLAVKLGEQAAKAESSGDVTAASRTKRMAAHLLAFRALREKFGLGRVREAFSGAAPIAPEVLQFFGIMGVHIREVYAMTENTALCTFTPADGIRVGYVGRPSPGVEIKIATDGEILTRSGGVFMGYLNNPEATKEAIGENGWLHTGDVGVIDDQGYLKITDRKKDLIITAGGKNISPSEIENKLKVSPYIRDAVVIGDERKYLVALLGIEPDTVGDWATRQGIAYTTYEDLSTQPAVRDLMDTWVSEVNGELAQVETIKYFDFMTKELDPEDGDVTATQKVKRRVIEDVFGEQIEAMYRARA